MNKKLPSLVIFAAGSILCTSCQNRSDGDLRILDFKADRKMEIDGSEHVEYSFSVMNSGPGETKPGSFKIYGDIEGDRFLIEGASNPLKPNGSKISYSGSRPIDPKRKNVEIKVTINTNDPQPKNNIQILDLEK